MPQNLKGQIKIIEPVSIDTFKMEIVSDLTNAKAGQFISILCPNKTLRRPFSIAGFKDNTLTILFKLKGEGTQYLSTLKRGDVVDFIAPLGNGFKIENKKSLLIGAGIGIAPMLFLKDELNKKNIENYLISGFKAQNEIIQGSDEVVVGGSVLDNIEALIEEYKPEIIYSCGPSVVLKLLSQTGEKYSIPTQLALEKVMACSIGVCRGCVIKIKKDDDIVMASVCKDGPVFDGSVIVWS